MSKYFMTYIKIITPFFSVCFCILTSTACFNSMIGDSDSNFMESISEGEKIIWQKPVKVTGKTIISGYIKKDPERFKPSWIISSKGEARLVELESSVSGGLPAKEKKIIMMVLSEKITLLFREWSPLLNENKPYSIRLITGVSTEELFSVFPVKKLPPVCLVPKTTSQIKWGTVSDRKGVKYLHGITGTSYGSLNLLWKKDGIKNPEIVIEHRPGSGELPTVERKLLLWIHDSAGVSYICQERSPQLNQGFISYLWCLAAVKTDEILYGYEILNGTVSDKN